MTTLYDPTGVIESGTIPLTERVEDVNGARLGVLNNTKWNSSKLLRGSVRELEERHGVKFAEVNFYDKHHFSSDAEPALLDQIAAENDIAMTAIGDCGSCTSSCVNDAIQLETRSVPSAVIVTTEFQREATLQRLARGMSDLEPIVIAHPISSLAAEQLVQRSVEVAPQALAIWTTGHRPG
jgi:MinD superfamily P-loop ATPase